MKKRLRKLLKIAEKVLVSVWSAAVYVLFLIFDTVKNPYRDAEKEYVDETQFWRGLENLNNNYSLYSRTLMLRDKF